MKKNIDILKKIREMQYDNSLLYTYYNEKLETDGYDNNGRSYSECLDYLQAQDVVLDELENFILEEEK